MSLLFLLASLGLSQKCSEYSCKSAATQFLPGQCIQSIPLESDTEKILLAFCTDQYHSYCPPANMNASCQLPPQQPTINIAGIDEPCTFDINCLDGICVDSKCTVLPDLNGQCQRDTQCPVGQYCNSACAPQVGLNGACTRDEMCKNNLGCHQGLCTNYFTINTTDELNECINNENYLCESGACRAVNGLSYCIPIMASPNPLPISCYYDDQCTINGTFGDNTNFTTSCTCGYNGFGFASCGLAPGDQGYLNYTKSMNKWLNSQNVSLCHTTRRTNLECIKHYWNYTNFVTLAYTKEYALNYPEIVYNDNCVKDIYQTYYWKLKQMLDDISNNNNNHHKKSDGIILAAIIGLFYF